MATQLKLQQGGNSIEVSDKAFGREFNEALVHQVVTAYMAGGRAGTKRQNADLVTAGGRVLNVVGLGRGLFEALSKTYHAVDKIFFDNMYYRKDIGHRATRTTTRILK